MVSSFGAKAVFAAGWCRGEVGGAACRLCTRRRRAGPARRRARRRACCRPDRSLVHRDPGGRGLEKVCAGCGGGRRGGHKRWSFAVLDRLRPEAQPAELLIDWRSEPKPGVLRGGLSSGLFTAERCGNRATSDNLRRRPCSPSWRIAARLIRRPQQPRAVFEGVRKCFKEINRWPGKVHCCRRVAPPRAMRRVSVIAVQRIVALTR
jgi:hypothetical protein